MKQRICIWIAAILLCLVLLPISGIAESSPIIVYLAEESPRPALNVDSLFEVHIIKADSSDSMLLRAGGKTMLVDSSTGTRAHLVINYLTKLGITELDYAFVTHTHYDHMGGFPFVMKKIPAKLFLYAPCARPQYTKESQELYKILRRKGIPYEGVENETEMYLGDVRLRFLNWDEPKGSQNNRSMIIHAQLGDRSILLGADIEGKGQKGLADAYGTALAADLMKVPHHGMINYLEAFWEAVQPKLALITCTPKRIPRLVKKMDQLGIEYRFTSDGNIIAVTEGESWQVWQEN